MAEFDNRYIEQAVKYMKDARKNFEYFGLNKVYSRRKVLGAIGLTIVGAKLMLSTSGCKSPFSSEEQEIIDNEEKGREIMMKACADEGLIVTENIGNKDYYIPWNGEMEDFKPDWGIGKPDDPHNRPYFAFGEWLSPEDGFTSKQLGIATEYNATMVNEANGGKGAFVMLDQKKRLTQSEAYSKTIQELKRLCLIA